MTTASGSPQERLGAISGDRTELLRLLLERRSRRSHEIRRCDRVAEGGRIRLPASWAQQRMWFIDQLEGGNAGYQVPVALRMRGTLNQAALEKALDALVQRHEVLRTVFVSADGELLQEIATAGRCTLLVVDLTDSASEDLPIRVRYHAAEETHGKFDLRTGPLIRGRLLRLRAQEHVLLITMHHIISDGWSKGVLVRELADLYSVQCAGLEDTLPSLPIQYADYAQWQRQSLLSGKLEKQLGYWRNRLQGAAPLLELPLDRPRPMARSYGGTNMSIALGVELSARLRDLAVRHQMTLFMLMYAAWAILLARLAGRQDVLVGMPVANRQRPEVEDLIGLFVNTLVLRATVRDDVLLGDFLEQVRELTLEAYDNQDVPFEQVVNALQVERTIGVNPLFQVAFAMKNMPKGEPRMPGMTATLEDIADEPAILDLMLLLEESGEEVVGTLNFATELFDRPTIERWMACFRALLEGITDERAVHGRIGDLAILPAEQRRHVVGTFNDTATIYPRDRPVQEIFEEHARATPDAIAVSFENESLTYAELNGRANQLARYLRAQGVQSGDFVPLVMARSTQMLVAQLAVIKSGGAYVPIDPLLPMERQAFMIRDCGARIVMGDRRPPTGADPASVRWICCADVADAVASMPTADLGLRIGARAAAYVMYTSGSTGIPKGVVVPHRGVMRLVVNTSYAQFEPTDCVAHCSNPAFDASTMEIWAALLNGARLLIVPQELVLEPERFAAVVKAQGVTVLFLTVGLFAQYAEVLGAAFGQLRYLITGGDVLEPNTVRRVLSGHPPRQLLNAYGPTENTTFTTTYLIEAVDDDATSIPIGRPVANTQVYILDDRRQPVPIGVAGEIYIGGDGVALGYLNRPELTAQRFVADPFSEDPQARLYRSGDLGRWRADGNIEFLGRNDLQVKLRGFRVELGEIEARLLEHSGVKEAVVLARQDSPGEKRLVGYIVAQQTRGHSSIVIDSQVHFVADLDDLVEVVRAAIRQLVPGGTIRLSHVRHLGLLSAMHTARELRSAAATVTVGQLRARIAKAVAEEGELAIDPQFFHLLPERVPEVSKVEVHLARGCVNESERSEYEVVLHKGEQPIARPLLQPVDWRTAVGSVEQLDAALASRQWCAVRVHSIPNARLTGDLALQELIATSDESVSIGALLDCPSEPPADAADPDTFWKMGSAHDYDVVVTWDATDGVGYFEVQFLDRTRTDQIHWIISPAPESPRAWSMFANDPLQNGVRRQLVPQLREHLQRRLPEYMIPSSWMVLKHLPLTPNGKVDRRALPEPSPSESEPEHYVAPCTDTERLLAEIWAEVLQVAPVGMQDNFFELGGHSLLGIKLVARVADRFGVRLPVVAVFQSPTVQQMAQVLESQKSAESQRSADTAPPAGQEVEEGVI
jgi:amino acid adenylation domain-containing protein